MTTPEDSTQIVRNPQGGQGGSLPERIAKLCGNHIGDAVAVLVELLHDEKRPQVRLQAAKCILDAAREMPAEGSGGPTQAPVVVIVQQGDPVPDGAETRDRAEILADARRKLRAG